MGPELVTKFTGDLSGFLAAKAQFKKEISDLETSTRRASAGQNQFAKSAQWAAAAATGEAQHLQKLTGSAGKLSAQLSTATAKANQFSAATDKSGKAAQNAGQKFDGGGSSLASLAKEYLSVAAVMGAGAMFVKNAVEVETFQAAIKAAGDSQEDFAHNMAFIEGVGDTYRKNTVELGKAFAMLANATKNTNLEGADTERLFKATVAASSALKLSMDDTTGTLRAFAQMVSKGNVQAEELRGQLGERLYGAFNLAAKAMGVSTTELNKMLERGEVLASDLLPKITVEMERAFGDQAIENANTLGNNLEYAAGQAKLFFAEFGKASGISDWFSDTVKGAGDLLNILRALNKNHGAGAAVGGLLGAGLEELSSNADGPLKGYKSPALEEGRRILAYDKSGAPDYAKAAQLALSGGGAKKPMSGLTPAPGMGPSIPQAGLLATYEPSEAVKKANKKAADKAAKEQAKNVRDAEATERKKSRAELDAFAMESAELSLQRTLAAAAKVDAEIAKINERRGRNVGPLGLIENRFSTSGVTAKQQGKEERTNFAINPLTKKGEGDVIPTSFSDSPDRVLAAMQGAIQSINDTAAVDWGKVLATQEMSQSFAEMDLALADMRADMNNALAGAAMDALYGMGATAAAMAQGTAGMQDVGQMMAQVVSQLAAQLGQSLIKMGMALLLGGPITAPMAAGNLAAGAALMVASGVIGSMGKRKSEKHAAGGIVGGRGGIDNVPTMLTRGEMVLNDSQQRNLFGLLNGGSQLSHTQSSDVMVANVRVQGSDLLLVLDRAKRSQTSYK